MGLSVRSSVKDKFSQNPVFCVRNGASHLRCLGVLGVTSDAA